MEYERKSKITIWIDRVYDYCDKGCLYNRYSRSIALFLYFTTSRLRDFEEYFSDYNGEPLS